MKQDTCPNCGRSLNTPVTDIAPRFKCMHCSSDSGIRLYDDGRVDVLHSDTNEFVTLKVDYLLNGEIMQTKYYVEPIRGGNSIWIAGTWDVEYDESASEKVYKGTLQECQDYLVELTGSHDKRYDTD